MIKQINRVLKETGHRPLKECTYWKLPDDLVVVFSIKTGKPIYAMRMGPGRDTARGGDDFFSIPVIEYAKVA